MTAVKISVSNSDIARVRALLSEVSGGAELAISRAVNQGISTGRTQGVKEIGKILNLKASRIKKDFDSRPASKSNLSGAVWAKGRPVGLLNFGARAVKSGYSVKVYRSGKRSLLKHAFKARTKKVKNDGTTYETEHLWWRKYDGPRSGTGTLHVGYFSRLPSDHYLKIPLKRLQSLRIEDVLARDEVLGKVQAAASEKMQTKLMVETERILARNG